MPGHVVGPSAHDSVIIHDAVRQAGFPTAADCGAMDPGFNAVAAVAADHVRARAVRLHAQGPGAVDVDLQRLVVYGAEKVGARRGTAVPAFSRTRPHAARRGDRR